MNYFSQAFFLSLFSIVTGDVTVYSQKTHRQIEMEFPDQPANFGASIPMEGIHAFVVYAEPANACSPLAPPPNVTNVTGRWAVLIRRYDCSFEEKVRRAQNASYDVAIIHNVNSSDLEPMHAPNPDGIFIPSIFVGAPTGLILKESYQYFMGFYIVIDDNSPFDINTHLLLPFAIVVGVCFITMIGFMVSMIVKCIKDHRRARRHRLPNSSLNRIPTAKFRKGDPYETCAICLEDYVEGEKLRILPCSHAYHCTCIDPWLTRNRRVCPVCKRKVFTGDTRSGDSDSSSDDDDHTPLMRSTQRTTTDGGTFTSRENAILRALRAPSFIEERRNALRAGPSSSHGSVNQQPQDQSDSSSVVSDTSWYTSSVEHLEGSNASISVDHVEEVDVYPRPDRSPSRNGLIGSHEEVDNERNDVIV